MNLLHLRLYLALLLSATAGIAGALAVSGANVPEMDRDTGQLSPLAGPSRADVQNFVERLGATNLFPSARTLGPTIAGNTDGMTSGGENTSEEEISQIDARPSIRALVRREARWRLYATNEADLTSVFNLGEELADGWIISDISAQTITLQKGDEAKTLNVFIGADAG